MIVVPALLGVALSGFVWEHLLLLGLWWVGYFAFFAGSQWLRSGRKARYWPPVRAYSLAMAPFAVGVVVSAPYLARWAVVFAPLVAVTVWASINRKDRTMANNAATITAAGLMLPVAYDMGVSTGGGDSGVSWEYVWLVTATLTWYFLGTALYVKTNIRERGERGWFVASVAFHAVGAAAVIAAATLGFLSWWLAGLWVIIAVRAVAVPLYGQREGWLSAKAIGLGEVAISVAFFFAVL